LFIDNLVLAQMAEKTAIQKLYKPLDQRPEHE